MIKKAGFVLLSTAIGISIFFVLVSKLGEGGILAQLSQFPLWQYLAISLLSFLFFLFVALTLHTLLDSFGYKTKIKNLFPLQMLKYSIGYITPFMNIGGEPAIIFLLRKKLHIKITHATTAVILERILRMTLTVILFIVGITTVFSRLLLSNENLTMLIVVVAAFALFFYLFYRGVLSGKGVVTSWIKALKLDKIKWVKKAEKELEDADRLTIRFFKKHKKEFARSMVFAGAAVSIVFLRTWLILKMLGYSARVTDLLLIFTLENLMILIPIPASLGTYEAGNAAVFALQGITANLGLVYSIIIRITYLIAILPGLIVASYYGITIGGKTPRR